MQRSRSRGFDAAAETRRGGIALGRRPETTKSQPPFRHARPRAGHPRDLRSDGGTPAPISVLHRAISKYWAPFFATAELLFGDCGISRVAVKTNKFSITLEFLASPGCWGARRVSRVRWIGISKATSSQASTYFVFPKEQFEKRSTPGLRGHDTK